MTIKNDYFRYLDHIGPGFVPIDDRAFGNSGGSPDHNFHFTHELQATFTYNANGGQFFSFTGNDDVWVFIDAKLAIDLGGVHAAADQYIDLTRLCVFFVAAPSISTSSESGP